MPFKARSICKEPGCKNLAEAGGYCREHYQEQVRRRDRSQQPWRKWYGTKLWLWLRDQQLKRQPFCEECLSCGEIVKATVVDHIIPHEGDWQLFCDPANHRSLCKSCHDRKTATYDGAFGNKKRRVGDK